MADSADDETMSEHWQSDSQDHRLVPCAHPALDAKPGLWDGKWAEFKRRFGASMKEDGFALIVIAVAVIVGLICPEVLGWR
ncbi:hypothetical protein [uncultured Dietzia sp.]|uniref:hypothetical protein n=1 Tax=uncultured Dietzia sp. TaxID=395519 RepID=UPI0026000786|nr:hypothetical protein [uncultured Dietzia sp.]